jgi:hypothetical protein
VVAGVPGGLGPGAPFQQAGGETARSRAADAAVSDLPDPRLLGRWRLFRADPSLDFAPNARMEFLSGGRLRYEFDTGGNVQSIMLVYQVEGETLTTDNPAASHLATARFSFAEGDALVLDFAGSIAWFLREV